MAFKKLNFIGAGVTAQPDGGDPTILNVTIPGGACCVDIQDNGVPLMTATTLNIINATLVNAGGGVLDFTIPLGNVGPQVDVGPTNPVVLQGDIMQFGSTPTEALQYTVTEPVPNTAAIKIKTVSASMSMGVSLTGPVNLMRIAPGVAALEPRPASEALFTSPATPWITSAEFTIWVTTNSTPVPTIVTLYQNGAPVAVANVPAGPVTGPVVFAPPFVPAAVGDSFYVTVGMVVAGTLDVNVTGVVT